MSVTIPDDIYLKFDQRGDTVLGYLVPYDPEEHDDFNKRKSSVDNWAGARETFVGSNEPAEGFEIVRYVSRHRTQNKVWRVRDPRGFELEVYCDNMLELIQNATIEEGVIQGEAIWGYGNGKVHLLVKGTQPYEKAKNVTDLEQKERVSLRDVDRGFVGLLKNGKRVRYLGGFHLGVWSYKSRGNYYLDRENRKYFYEILGDSSGDDPSLKWKSSLDFKEINEEESISKQEARSIVHEYFGDESRDVARKVHYNFVSPSKFDPDEVKITLEEAEDDLLEENFVMAWERRGEELYLSQRRDYRGNRQNTQVKKDLFKEEGGVKMQINPDSTMVHDRYLSSDYNPRSDQLYQVKVVVNDKETPVFM